MYDIVGSLPSFLHSAELNNWSSDKFDGKNKPS